MNEVEESAVLEDELNNLGDSPTARQIMDVISGFSDNAINIALKRTGGGGGGLPTGWTQQGNPALLSANGGSLNLAGGGSLDMEGSDINDPQLRGATLGDDLDVGSFTITGDGFTIENLSEIDFDNGAFMGSVGGGGVMVDGTDVNIGGGSAAVGFYGATPVPQQTGVAVDAASIHAALVALGLITA